MKEAYQYRGKYRKRGVEKGKSLIDAMNEAIKKMEVIKPICAYTREEMIHLMECVFHGINGRLNEKGE